jgi:hypothetical protein
VQQNGTYYRHAAQNHIADTPVPLNEAERKAIVKEADHSFSETGMYSIIAIVALSALLQGIVQSSQAGANLFSNLWISKTSDVDGRYALTNAVTFLSAGVM